MENKTVMAPEANSLNESKEDEKAKGIRISRCAGFLLVFLAVAVPVAVGLIVHFVEKTPKTCNEQIVEECKEIAKNSSAGICHPEGYHKDEKNARLQKNIKPLHYDLELRPNMYDIDPSTFTFHGCVKITMECIKAASTIVMHAKHLDITSGSVAFWANETDNGPQYVSHEIDKDNERLRIHLSRNMDIHHTYVLQLNFSGPLEAGDLHGLYLSSYKRGNNTVYQAATQFESRSARKAFPCFDEPELKARFDVTLVRKKELTSISNMDIQRVEQRDPGFEADVYRTTPIMSTYLLAFIVSDFRYINGTTDHGLEFRVWGQEEHMDWLQYGLKVGMKTLAHYEDYFNISFPLPKQDMVALPEFGPGAMENWGCITYRAEELFYKKGLASSTAQQVVLIDITHELAHQWFGDLVTMEWWDDIWLNEGFATFFGFMEADYIEPGFDMYNIFVIDQIAPVFETDGVVTSHPIIADSGDPNFDEISYNKAGSLLRMLKFFVGDDTFRRGLTRYLRSRAYGNANHNDLWRALHEQAKDDQKTIDVVDTMKTWTLQMNYPVVTVSRVGDKQLRLQQSRFLLDDAADDPGTFKSPFNYKWNIPFTFTTSDKRNFNVSDRDIVWMLRNEKTDIHNTSVPDARDESKWILGNVLHHGFYRVNYEVDNWRNIIKQLKRDHNAIAPINRAQIINDAIDLSRWVVDNKYNNACVKVKSSEIYDDAQHHAIKWRDAEHHHKSLVGLLDKRLALGTLEYLSDELSYYPWKLAIGKLDHVDKILRKTEIYIPFKDFMRNSTRNAFNHFGLQDPGNSHPESLAQVEVIAAACRYSNPACLQEARRMFINWKHNPDVNSIHPDVLKTVLCTGISEGVADDWYFLYDMYKAETMVSVKNDMMEALACTQEPWLMRLYLDKAVQIGEVKKSVGTRPLYSGPAINPSLQPVLWDFVREKYALLRDKFSTMSTYFTKMVLAATDTFNTEFKLQELEQFINSTTDLGVGEKGFKQAVKATKLNIKWMKETYPVVKQWLRDLGY